MLLKDSNSILRVYILRIVNGKSVLRILIDSYLQYSRYDVSLIRCLNIANTRSADNCSSYTLHTITTTAKMVKDKDTVIQ